MLTMEFRLMFKLAAARGGIISSPLPWEGAREGEDRGALTLRNIFRKLSI